MIKLVAFDLDGTIANTLPMCVQAFEKTISPYVGHTLSKDEIAQTFGLNESGMVKFFVKDEWEKALNEFFSMYEELHDLCDTPMEGIRDLIEQLRECGVILPLITGKGQECCDITLRKLQMNELFSDIYPGNEFRIAKKDAMFDLMSKYHVEADECIYIGDAVSDVTASKEAGWKCYSVAWCETADRDRLMEVNGDLVFDRVQDLAKELSAQIDCKN